jgi:hypothetical protein
MEDNKTATLDELREMWVKNELESTLPNAPEVDTPEWFWDVATPRDFKAKKQPNEDK